MAKATASSKRAVRKSEALDGGNHLEIRIIAKFPKAGSYFDFSPSGLLDQLVDVIDEWVSDDGNHWVYAAEAIELTPELFKSSFEGLKA